MDPPTPFASPATVELAATEPTWVSFIDAGGKKLFVGLLEPGQTRTVKVSADAVLRTGNAAGLVLHFNGKPVGPIGYAGQVRQVDFKDGTYQIVPAAITPREK